MTVIPHSHSSLHDPLLPYLLSVRKALDNLNSGSDGDLQNLLYDCIRTFKYDDRYRNDPRFLKIWFLYMDGTEDYQQVFSEMEDNKICAEYSLLYEAYALFLEAKGKLIDAFKAYHLGISRNAKPLEQLKKAQVLFLGRMSEIVDSCSFGKVDLGKSIYHEKFVNPWSISVIKDLLKKKHSQIAKYDGYHASAKAFPGKISLSSLRNASRNKVVEIVGTKYQIKGCAGQGGFAQVLKAYVNSNPDEVVALKIQKPPFPWEFYIYRQLDMRITDKERSSFGFVHKLHMYTDYSILICDYLSHGTLQDVINSYVVINQSMEEMLCVYYTIEMLCMLETLHGVGIIHGDFKPDNLLIRYSRDELTEDGFRERTGPWHDQGLCLVDWGRGIDLSLFPEDTEFNGDCRTSCFRCMEMQENKPWKFQVDTYGLCVVVHMMLHNSFLEITKKPSPDGSFSYQPKTALKRYWNAELWKNLLSKKKILLMVLSLSLVWGYWNAELWKNLFSKLLNRSSSENDVSLLRSLRESFQDYMCSNPQLIRKLKLSLLKQRTSLCSA